MQLTTDLTKKKDSMGRSKRNASGAPNGARSADWSGVNEEVERLAEAARNGMLSERARPDRFAGEQQQLIAALNEILDSRTSQMEFVLSAIAQIGRGEIPQRCNQVGCGDFEEMRIHLNGFIDAISAVLDEIKRMSDEHNKGDIDVIITPEKFQGAFRTMAVAINDMVAGHIAVKKKAMACVDEFSKGNFEAPLERFPGKKAFINDTIERLRANVKTFIAEMNRMSDEHNQGDIDVTIPLEKFEGSFRVMAQGVNDMVAGHITVKKKAMACIAEFGRGNFEAPLEKFPGKKAFINETIEQVRANLISLIADMNALVKAAVAGKLATRADASRHGGDYRRIVDGVNQTLDAVIGPLNVAADYVARISKGDIPPPLPTATPAISTPLRKTSTS